MPCIPTRDFGPLDYDPSAELHFPLGVPGFEKQTRFILIEKATLAPIVFLQSAETEALCFLTIPVQMVDPGYQIGMMDEDVRMLALDATDPSEILFLAILSANANAVATANLLAPVVINLKTKIGLQAVRPNSHYSHQHPLPEAVAC